MKRRIMALFLALAMLIGMAPAVFAADTSFSDVAADAWYAEAVAWAVENDITGGIGNNMFGPDNTCTRGQVVTFLWAAAGKPEPTTENNPFTDVSASDWYYKAVMWAVENTVTGGTSATTFSPEAPCTRAAVVTFLYAAEGKPTVAEASNDFVDVADGDWFYGPVMWAVANDITGGIGNGCFGPDRVCTRGQIALFLYKASLVGEDEVTPAPAPAIEYIEDAADAIEQLAAADSGYANALSELTEKTTNTIEGDSYYRLQQNYKGIPVYGRTVVCAADENGKVMSVTGNVADVDENVDLTPSVSLEQVEAAVDAYLGDNSDVAIPMMTDEELVIYVDDGTSALAYALTVYVDGELHEVVADADSGAVYAMQSLVRTETVSKAYRLEDGEKLLKLNFRNEDGVYFMDDQERNIQVSSADGNSVSHVLCLLDDNDEVLAYYSLPTGQWYDSQKNLLSAAPDVIHEKVKYCFFVGKNELQPLKSNSNNEVPKRALEVMSYAVNVYDMYEVLLQRKGWSNDPAKALPIVYDIQGTVSSSHNNTAGVSAIEVANNAEIDTVAHEFTHSVNFAENRLMYFGESGAIDEALADIFGELAQYYYYNECDWKHRNGLRDLVAPEQSTEGSRAHPRKYKGNDWYSGNDIDNYVHWNSTVISHAAYLMSTDGGGKLTIEELAELWYRAMLMMPSDCDFHKCRRLVELAAVNMELDNDQLECISCAFDEVGISFDGAGERATNLHPDGTFSLYGITGEPYGNYTLEMTLNSAYDDMLLVGNEGSAYVWREVGSAEPIQLNLEWGVYNCKAIDASNPRKTKEFNIYVTYYQEDDHIDIYTDFGGSNVTGGVFYLSDVGGVQYKLAIQDAVVTVYEKMSEKYVDSVTVEDINKGFALTLPYGNYTLEASADGYVTKKTDLTVGTEDVELNIILESTEADNSAAYAAYVPMVEQAIADTNEGWSIDAVAKADFAQGYLADLDGDGIDELLMCYIKQFTVSGYKSHQPVYSLYDYENGQLVKVVEGKRLIEAWAGGESGSAAIVSFDGKPTVMIMDQIGDGSGAGVSRLYNYEFYDYPSMQRKHLLGYWQEDGAYGIAREKYYINNAEVTKSSFLADLERCSELKFSQSGYDFYSGDPMSLKETLAAVRGPVIYKGNVYETKFVDGVKTDLPVPFAEIKLWCRDEEQETEITETVYADENGCFEVDLTETGGYDAEISAEGFISKTTSFSASDEKLEASVRLAPDTYEAVAQAFMDKHGYDYMAENQKNRSRGMLYDLNGDGQDELILRAMLKDGKVFENTYEIWTVVNGETKLLLEYTPNLMGEYLFLAEYNGKRYFAMEEVSPGTMAAAIEWRFYDVNDIPYKTALYLDYWEMHDGSEGTYAIDGRDVTKAEFYGVYDRITTVFELFKEWENGYDGYPLHEFVYQEVG